MNKNIVFAVSGLTGCLIAYQIGKAVGCIKTLKFEVDCVESACPGFKKNVIEEGSKGVAKGIVNSVLNMPIEKDK